MVLRRYSVGIRWVSGMRRECEVCAACYIILSVRVSGPQKGVR